MTTVFLSRPYRPGLHLYGGRDNFQMEVDGQLSRGDTANSLKICLSNHAGTHLDFPAHVHPGGKTIDDYPADYFVFCHPAVLEIALPPGRRYLDVEDFKAAGLPVGADLLLIRTGVDYRHEDYWRDNPGLGPSVAEFLKNLQPPPRCVGLDFISVNAFCDRGPGRLAHKILLAEPEILILEDMDLTPLSDPRLKLIKVMAAPLRLAGADGTPATVLAEIYP